MSGAGPRRAPFWPKGFEEYLHEAYTVYGGPEGRWAALGGLDFVRENWPKYWMAQPTVSIVVEDIIAEGDKVAVRLTRMQEGKPVANQIAFYRIADGKIVEDWFCTTEIEQ